MGNNLECSNKRLTTLLERRNHKGEILIIPTLKWCCNIIEHIQAVTNLSMNTQITNGLMWIALYLCNHELQFYK